VSSVAARSSKSSRTPLWLALTAGLVAAAFSRAGDRRTSGPPTPTNRPVGGALQRGDQLDRQPTKGPTEVSPRSWKGILKGLWQSFTRDRVLALAAGVAFYAILAIFPALAAVVALYGLFADPTTIAGHLDAMGGVLPRGGMDVLRDQLTRVASTGNSTLGIAFLIGLAVSLWSANSGMKALFDTLNLVFKAEEKRGFIKLNAVSLAFTMAVIVLALLALGAIVIVPIALSFLGLQSTTDALIAYLRWPILLVIVGLALSLIYRFGPSRENPHWNWITLGSACASLLWLTASVLFSWYAENFGSYNKTYGTLGAAIGFMVWIWISIITVLLGAELDAQGEQKAKRADS
jgi:membrane protein